MLTDRKTLIEKKKTLIDGKKTLLEIAEQRNEVGWPGNNQPHSWALSTCVQGHCASQASYNHEFFDFKRS